MPTTVELTINSSPADDSLYDAIQELQVEESADRPDTLLIRLPVNRTPGGDLQFVGDGTFEPFTTVALVLTPSGGSPQCVFNGFVLSWRLNLDRTSGASTIDIWAHDASWLMSGSDTVREWSGLTDGQIANEIFKGHGFQQAAANTTDDSPPHAAASHTLLQRGTELQFLRMLGRRNGKVVRVACTDRPGTLTGYFVKPDVEAKPSVTLDLIDPDFWTVDSLEFDWDVMRPTEVTASQVALEHRSSNGDAGNATTTGLKAMDARDYPTYSGSPTTLLLTPIADAPELTMRSTAALREAEWFVRCRGEASVDRLGAILRVGTVVALQGVGNLHSGNWFVWSVRHEIAIDSIVARFTLVRNAVGPASSGGAVPSPPWVP
jgi:hypothetical protein